MAMWVHLSIGSNRGKRGHNLNAAVRAMEAMTGLAVLAVSPVYETEPVGPVQQRRFLNAAVAIETDFTPLELLERLKTIERALGREPEGTRWGPRIIDIDIVLWGDLVLESPVLSIPHKAFRERAFVLRPLADLAPQAIDPVSGQTIAQLAAALPGRGQVFPYYGKED